MFVRVVMGPIAYILLCVGFSLDTERGVQSGLHC